MRRAGQWMIVIPLAALTLVMFTTGFLALLHPGTSGSFGDMVSLIFLFMPFAIPGAVLWLAAWIVEGFVKEVH